MVSANDKLALGLSLSAGNEHDSPEGRKLLSSMKIPTTKIRLLMDRAYEGDETRRIAEELGYIPVVPPKSNRKTPWEYDKELYKQRNIVERLFRRLKEFRRIFTRYDKLDIVFLSFVYFGLSIIMIK
jgi:transposase